METGTGIDPGQWVAVYGDSLFRFAVARVRDRHAAEELLQETFLAALKGREKFRGEATERTWLVGILKRKIVDWFRARAAKRDRESATFDDELDSPYDPRGHWKASNGPWSLDAVTGDEFRAALADCLDHLPVALREAFVLRYLEEKETEEIGRVSGWTANHVWVTLHRARLRLWKCLSARGFGEPS